MKIEKRRTKPLKEPLVRFIITLSKEEVRLIKAHAKVNSFHNWTIEGSSIAVELIKKIQEVEL